MSNATSNVAMSPERITLVFGGGAALCYAVLLLVGCTFWANNFNVVVLGQNTKLVLLACMAIASFLFAMFNGIGHEELKRAAPSRVSDGKSAGLGMIAFLLSLLLAIAGPAVDVIPTLSIWQ